jgi:cytochrome c oxidase subunit 2
MPFRHVFGQDFGLEVALAAAVFALVIAAMVAAVLMSWRRRRRDRPPSARAEHDRAEAGYVLGLTAIAVFLAVVSLSSNSAESAGPPPALTVQVTAFQWCWQFHYAGRPVTINARCNGGPVPTLVLPAGRPVRLLLRSRDVIHSFWLPWLRYKRDVYPGHVNTFTLTLPAGRWLGRCAQFCGLHHYQMTFYVHAVPAARFARWLHASSGALPVVGAR